MALFAPPRRSPSTRRTRPRTESRGNDYALYEEDDKYVLSVELPGFEVEDITLTWDDGLLRLAAERDDDKRGERTYHRQFRLPERIDDEDVEARYENGILEVRLPKRSTPSVEGKRIEVTG
ncbi:MAG: Hsp20/alpha crystallin family protein [Halobacterium sp.]